MPAHIYLWHPIFVHFTLALLWASTLLYVIARVTTAPEWRRRFIAGAELNLWGGTGLTLLTVIFGWLAFDTVPHDDAAHPVMHLHRSLALATFGWFVAVALLSAWLRGRAAYPSIWFLVALVIGAAGLVGTGMRGGELVYEHGVAVAGPTAAESDVKGRDGHHDHPEHASDGPYAGQQGHHHH